MLAHYGILIGVSLVCLAAAIAFAIAARAARNVEQFRHEDHELFQRTEQPGSHGR